MGSAQTRTGQWKSGRLHPSAQKSPDSRNHPAAARQPPDRLLRNMVVWGGKEVSAYRGVGVGPEPEEMFLTQMGPAARLVRDF
jgi:hypothetical protein